MSGGIRTVVLVYVSCSCMSAFASSYMYDQVDLYLREVKAGSNAGASDRDIRNLVARASEVEKALNEAVRSLQQRRSSLADSERDLARYIGVKSTGLKEGLDPYQDRARAAEIGQAVTRTCCRLKLDKVAADQVFDNYSHDRPLLEGIQR